MSLPIGDPGVRCATKGKFRVINGESIDGFEFESVLGDYPTILGAKRIANREMRKSTGHSLKGLGSWVTVWNDSGQCLYTIEHSPQQDPWL